MQCIPERQISGFLCKSEVKSESFNCYVEAGRLAEEMNVSLVLARKILFFGDIFSIQPHEVRCFCSRCTKTQPFCCFENRGNVACSTPGKKKKLISLLTFCRCENSFVFSRLSLRLLSKDSNKNTKIKSAPKKTHAFFFVVHQTSVLRQPKQTALNDSAMAAAR